MPTKTVRYDECLVSIAIENGVSPEDLKRMPENQTVLNDRSSAVCLSPGDEITLPEQVPAGRALTLNGHTVLKVRRPLFRLAITLLNERADPLKNQAVRFVWSDDTKPLHGTTNGRGIVHFELPLDCCGGLLGYEYRGDVIFQPITIGTLRPFEDPVGKVQRLCALYGQAVTSCAATLSDVDCNTLLESAAADNRQEKDSFIQQLKGRASV